MLFTHSFTAYFHVSMSWLECVTRRRKIIFKIALRLSHCYRGISDSKEQVSTCSDRTDVGEGVVEEQRRIRGMF